MIEQKGKKRRTRRKRKGLKLLFFQLHKKKDPHNETIVVRQCAISFGICSARCQNYNDTWAENRQETENSLKFLRWKHAGGFSRAKSVEVAMRGRRTNKELTLKQIFCHFLKTSRKGKGSRNKGRSKYIGSINGNVIPNKFVLLFNNIGLQFEPDFLMFRSRIWYLLNFYRIVYVFAYFSYIHFNLKN